MRIEYLYEFVTLTELLNFSKTANHYHISQSTLSKHIQAIEQHYDLKLLDRDRSSVELTYAGRVFYENVFPLLEHYSNLQVTMEKLRTRSHKTIKLSGRANDQLLLNAIFKAFHKTELTQNGQFEFQNQQKYNYLELFAFTSSDMVLLYRTKTINVSNLFVTSLLHDRFVAIVDADSHFANKPSLSLNDIKDEPIVRLIGQACDNGWDVIAETFENHGFSLKTTARLAEPGSEIIVLKKLNGIYILPESSVQCSPYLSSPSFACIPLSDEDAYFDLCLFYPRESQNKVLPVLAENLIEAFRDINPISKDTPDAD